MSLLRFAARSLFASYFIADGIKAITHSAERAAEVENFTATVSPLVQRAVPPTVAAYVPEKPETWVRAAGVAQVVGGAMFATGIGRRLGALLLAKASVLNLAGALPSKDAAKAVKDAARPEVLRQAAFLGAAVLATQDLQGKPGLAWRAQQAAKASGKQAASISEDVQRQTKKFSRQVKRQQRQLSKKLESVSS